MQKIMFNDKFGLTDAVLNGSKTMTRRFAEKVLVEDENCDLRWNGQFKPAKYKVGEVVAVAQPYRDIRDIIGDVHDGKSIKFMAGWNNKMFVRADLMPYRIRITSVRTERLRDISDEDCLREGIVKAFGLYGCEGVCERGDQLFFCKPREAFAALIDKINGKGTYDSNPWVCVYEFELVK